MDKTLEYRNKQIEIIFDVYSDETITDTQKSIAEDIKQNYKSYISVAEKNMIKTFEDYNRKFIPTSFYIFREKNDTSKSFAILYEIDIDIESEFPCALFENNKNVKCGYDVYLI